MQRRFSRTSLSLTFVAAVVIASQSFAQPNLLTNPGFETAGGSYTGWITFGAGMQLSLPAGDNIIRTGVAASKAYGGFVGCPTTPAFNVGGYFQSFTPVAGQLYQLSGYSYISGADPIPGTDTCNKNRMIAKVVFYNAASGGSEIASNEVVIGDGNSVVNQWNAFSVSAPVPVGALRVQAMLLFLQPGCDLGAVYVDDVAFSALTPPAAGSNLLANPSFGTLLTGWTTFGNAFHDARAFAVRTPAGAAKLFSTFNPGSDSGLYQTFAATPGSKWKLSAYAMTTCQENPITGTNDNLGIARIVFRDAGNNDIGSTQTVLVDYTAPLGTWVQHAVISPAAPAGTVSAQAYLLFVSPSIQGGAMFVDDVSFRQLESPTDVVPGTPGARVALHQNVPNPFNPSTRIDFDLTRRDAVDITVYDIAGRRMATLLQGTLESGPHTVAWDGKNASGAAAPAGIYRYVLTTSAGRLSRSMALVK